MKLLALLAKEVITDGNDEIKQCPNCGECIYLFDAEDVKRYPTNEAAKLKEIPMRAMKKSDRRSENQCRNLRQDGACA